MGEGIGSDLTLTAARYDADRPGRIVLLEHGAGQIYRHARRIVDAGGGGILRNVVLYIGPNEATCDVMAQYLPNARMIVASPIVEWMQTRTRRPELVGFATHWPSPLATTVLEAGTTWPDSAGILKALPGPKVAHCHPRGAYRMERDLRRRNIDVPFVDNWDALWPDLRLLVVDNSSILWEAAAVGIDVAVIDGKYWEMRHGLRFGREAAPLFRVNVANAPGILEVDLAAPAGSPYQHVEGATATACDAIVELLTV